MTTITRTNSQDPHFRSLVHALDQYLAIRNGASNDFFVQFNKIDLIQHVVVAYSEGVPVGCGAMKEYNRFTMEVKRMYVLPEMRGKGVAVAVLHDLENWARELGYEKCVLETGKDMPEAMGLYRKSAYKTIPNYGPYEKVESSICFEKVLK